MGPIIRIDGLTAEEIHEAAEAGSAFDHVEKFWDRSLRLWTVLAIAENGEQVEPATYARNKAEAAQVEARMENRLR